MAEVCVEVEVKRQGKGRANCCKFCRHKHYMVLFVALQVVALEREVC